MNCVQRLHEAPPCHSTPGDLQPLIDVARGVDQATDGVALSAKGQCHVQAIAQAHLRPKEKKDDDGLGIDGIGYAEKTPCYLSNTKK